jgi:hypothetical protein
LKTTQNTYLAMSGIEIWTGEDGGDEEEDSSSTIAW